MEPEEGTVAPPAAEHADDEYFLPDLPLYTVLSHLDAPSLRACRAVSLRFRDLAGSERLWRELARADLSPAAAAYLDTPAFSRAPTAQARYAAAAAARALLRGARGLPPPGRRVPSAAAAVYAHAASTRGPIFCVNSVRAPNNAPALLAAGGEGIVSVITLERSGAARAAGATGGEGGGEGGAAADNAPEARADSFGDFLRGVLKPALAAKGGARGIATRVAAEWGAHDGGMLGLSVDETGRGDAKGPGPTVITCAFSGDASL
jgi:hypothetical protein